MVDAHPLENHQRCGVALSVHTNFCTAREISKTGRCGGLGAVAGRPAAMELFAHRRWNRSLMGWVVGCFHFLWLPCPPGTKYVVSMMWIWGRDATGIYLVKRQGVTLRNTRDYQIRCRVAIRSIRCFRRLGENLGCDPHPRLMQYRNLWNLHNKTKPLPT